MHMYNESYRKLDLNILGILTLLSVKLSSTVITATASLRFLPNITVIIIIVYLNNNSIPL